MKKNKIMIHLASTLLLSTLISPAVAIAEEAPDPAILENWSCNYKPGKDRDDLMAARDYMVRQAAKANIELPDSYVWHGYKGGAGLDHIWFAVHDNLQAFVANNTAFGAAPEMAEINERFDAVADCQANVGTVRPVFQGSAVDEDAGGSAFIASNACMLHDGVSEADVVDLENHIRGVLGEVDEYDNVTVYLGSPMTNSPGGADAYLFAVHESLTSWAAASKGFGAAPGRASLVRHFNATMDCNTALWTSEQVVGN